MDVSKILSLCIQARRRFRNWLLLRYYQRCIGQLTKGMVVTWEEVGLIVQVSNIYIYNTSWREPVEKLLHLQVLFLFFSSFLFPPSPPLSFFPPTEISSPTISLPPPHRPRFLPSPSFSPSFILSCLSCIRLCLVSSSLYLRFSHSSSRSYVVGGN